MVEGFKQLKLDWDRLNFRFAGKPLSQNMLWEYRQELMFLFEKHGLQELRWRVSIGPSRDTIIFEAQREIDKLALLGLTLLENVY